MPHDRDSQADRPALESTGTIVPMTDTTRQQSGDEHPRIARRTFLAGTGLAGAGALAGCFGGTPAESTTTATGTSLEGTIKVAGSSTVYPLTLRVGEQYAKRHPKVSISVASTGTGGGFADFFCTGETDINDASRPIAASERARCSTNDVEFVRFQVATDALTVIVNAAADWVDCLTPAELATVWETGGASTWADVRPGWPDEPLERYGPTRDSGTFDYFAEEIIGSVDAHRQDYDGTEQDSTIVENVRQSRHAIGYLGFAYYTQNSDRVRALAIDDGDGCVRPSLETAESGTYSPLSRPLFVYVAREAIDRPVVESFLRYYLEVVETDLVSDVGYVPLNAEAAAANRRRLERVLDGQ